MWVGMCCGQRGPAGREIPTGRGPRGQRGPVGRERTGTGWARTAGKDGVRALASQQHLPREGEKETRKQLCSPAVLHRAAERRDRSKKMLRMGTAPARAGPRGAPVTSDSDVRSRACLPCGIRKDSTCTWPCAPGQGRGGRRGPRARAGCRVQALSKAQLGLRAR